MIKAVHNQKMKENGENGEKGEAKLKLEAKDRLAIILAVWRIILPWGLLIIAIYFFIFLLFDVMF